MLWLVMQELNLLKEGKSSESRLDNALMQCKIKEECAVDMFQIGNFIRSSYKTDFTELMETLM